MIKEINGLADLAINGAAPAFEQPLHVGRPNLAERAVFDRYLDQIFESNWLTNNGPLVQQLELEVSRRLGVDHCVAMCNGTIALEIAIRALELTGEVILPSYTFVATAHAVSWQGLQPVFADIDPVTHNLDPASVERLITPATTGIVGVHLWGRPAPVGELAEVARDHDVKLLFDASHAFACSMEGTSIGNFGECEVFSFHATKVFNSFEGGVVSTNNAALAEKMRLMRNFGFAGNDNVIHPGTNGKMTEVCAAMGLSNLELLDSYLDHNRHNFAAYQRGIEGVDGLRLLAPPEPEGANFQYIVIEVGESFGADRDEVLAALEAENVLARRYFWPGCHKMQPYRETQPTAELWLPHTTEVASRVLVLPTGKSVGDAEIDIICRIFRLLGAGSAGARAAG